MKVAVLGPGCAKCKKLYQRAEEAVGLADVAVELTKVEKLQEIMAYGVAFTPALVIDGTIKSTGKVPSAKQIAGWLAEADS